MDIIRLWILLVVAVLIGTMWLVIFSFTTFDSRLDKLECQECNYIAEDDPRWNCETMGNMRCG